MSLKKLVDRGYFYIFHFYCIFINKYFLLFQKNAEISNLQIFVSVFCTFYKTPMKKSLIFEKFLQEFSLIPTAAYLPAIQYGFLGTIDVICIFQYKIPQLVFSYMKNY